MAQGKPELIAMLRSLADRLESGESPFVKDYIEISILTGVDGIREEVKHSMRVVYSREVSPLKPSMI